MTQTIRLSKLLADRGLCSRREADRFIAEGQVLVDGEVVNTLGVRVHPEQEVALSPQAARRQENLVTVLVNKPAGYVSGLPEKGYRSAVMLITDENRHVPSQKTPTRHGLAPGGRLDIDSTGLLVYTRDGRIARTLVGPDSGIEKEYHVQVTGRITQARLQRLRHGLSLDNRKLRPAKIEQLDDDRIRFELVEGRKRQIRRMCELVDLEVTRLKRVRIGEVRLGGLKSGRWRLLGRNESFQCTP